MSNFKKVVVINGPAGAGKDSFVHACEGILELGFPDYIQVYNLSSIDPVKRIARDFGWDGVKDQAGRQFLADLKMAWAGYNNGPFNYLLDSIKTIKEGLVFLHVREPEEIMKLKEAYPEIILLHVDREGAIRAENGADNRTLELDYDVYIDNNGGLNELQRLAMAFLTQLAYSEIRELREKLAAR